MTKSHMNSIRHVLIVLVLFTLPLAAQQFDRPEKRNVERRRGFVASMRMNVTDSGYDVLHYRLALDFAEDLETYDGQVTIRFQATEVDLDEVYLHAVDLEIDTVRLWEEKVNVTPSGEGFTVALGQTFSTDDTFSISIDYRGAAGERGYRNHEFCAFTFSEPEDARRWFPCRDVPWDKATAEIIVTVPLGVEVASVGLLQKRELSGDGQRETFFWRTDLQVATYLFCVTMSPYYARWSDWYVTAQGDSIELPYYVFEWDSAYAVYDTYHMVDGIRFFSETYGSYPFEKYGTAEVDPAPFGGMEHQTMTTINGSWITGTRSSEYGLIHELAHMWWGDAVTLNEWPAIWLNEGFAVYSEALFFEDYRGTPWLHGKMGYCESVYFSRASTTDFPIYDPGFDELFNWGIIYNKGAWILHMLRHVVGDTAFFQILRDYYAAYEYGNASIADFRTVCETVSGMELSWFFQQWIYDQWVPELEYGWISQEMASGSFEVTLMIDQVQESGPETFRMPLDIRIADPQESVLDTVIWIGEGVDTYAFVVPFEPSGLELDPENWILMLEQEVSMEYRRSDAVPGSYAVLQNYPNPFNATTTIHYDIKPETGGNQNLAVQRTVLAVYDSRGRRIRTLADTYLDPGEYWAIWDGRDDAGRPMSSGIYIIRLEVESVFKQVKTVLLR